MDIVRVTPPFDPNTYNVESATSQGISSTRLTRKGTKEDKHESKEEEEKCVERSEFLEIELINPHITRLPRLICRWFNNSLLLAQGMLVDRDGCILLCMGFLDKKILHITTVFVQLFKRPLFHNIAILTKRNYEICGWEKIDCSC